MLLAGALPVAAGTVTYNYGDVSSGASPAGSPPWVQAIFSDTAPDTVQLTLSAGNLTGNEFVSCWYFNLNPGMNPAGLTFAVSSTGGAFAGPTIKTGADGYKAGPDGKFDLMLSFATGGDNSARFTSGDSITFDITGISGLTADDFNQLSTTAGGSGAYPSAAHIQDIPPDGGSGWVNPTATILSRSTDQRVPDASTTIALLGTSLVAIQGLRRKLKVK